MKDSFLRSIVLFGLIFAAFHGAAFMGGAAARADDAPPCVSVRAGNISAPAFDCINARLRAMAAAEQMRQQLPVAPAADPAASPDRVGDTTHAGAALRFGPNFGVSPQPYRPANSATYGNPNGLAGLLGR